MMWHVLLSAGVVAESMSYAIFDKQAFRPGVPYILVEWGTRKLADQELQLLLRDTPADSEWRKRLFVAPKEKGRILFSKTKVSRLTNNDAEKEAGDPRSGPGTW
jgi:hypothetical protein